MNSITEYYMAQAISVVFHPLLIPSWLTLLLYKDLLPVMFVYTALVPALCIYVLYKLNWIQTLDLSDRQERSLPYALCLVCYLICIVRLEHSDMPFLGTIMMIGACLTLWIVMLFNRRWKVSAHAAGMGGVMGFTIACMLFKRSMLWYPLLTVAALSLVVIYARLYLNAHTWKQMVAGWLTGVVMTIVPYGYILCLHS